MKATGYVLCSGCGKMVLKDDNGIKQPHDCAKVIQEIRTSRVKKLVNRIKKEN